MKIHSPASPFNRGAPNFKARQAEFNAPHLKITPGNMN